MAYSLWGNCFSRRHTYIRLNRMHLSGVVLW